MKKLEIKSVGVVSMGKTIVYIMLIPMVLLLVIGFFALLIGILIQQSEVAIFGGIYMVMPIIILVFYGLISMLIGLVYNWLAGKFGGLEITITEPATAAAEPITTIEEPTTAIEEPTTTIEEPTAAIEEPYYSTTADTTTTTPEPSSASPTIEASSSEDGSTKD